MSGRSRGVASGERSAGTVAPGFEAVRRQFEANLADHERGAAFSAVMDGELVVDLWGGISNAATEPVWQEDTLCMFFSGSKGLVATCMLQLIDRGLIDLQAPVARYWPEFSAKDKDGVLVRHVVSHQAGLPGIRKPISADDVPDHALMTALLAEQAGFWPPGSRTWYHPLTYGWLCGELVRRVTGKPIGRYLRDEVASPLGLELWIGIPPALEGRVAKSELADTWPGVATNGPGGSASEADLHDVWRNPELFREELDWNRPSWRQAEIPAVNAIGTARSMALHYGALAIGGTMNGYELLSRHALELGQSILAEGVDPFDGEFLRFGVGWALQTSARPFGPPRRAFGHGGAGGSIHGAWPVERVGFSYLPNLMREDEQDRRGAELLSALHACALERGARRPHATIRRYGEGEP